MRILLFVCLLYSGHLMAQESLSKDSLSQVYRDPRVDSLVKKQIQINEVTTRDSRRNVAGYRIQVANSSDRNQVFTIKAKIYQMYPELKPYLIYQPPNYKLRVGNFRTPEEAEEYLQKLTRDFPSDVYLVHDTIEVKPD